MIDSGEFWIVDQNDKWDSPHRIGSSPAILADNWEGNAIAGRVLMMKVVDSKNQITNDELNQLHRTWETHVEEGSLSEIRKIARWQAEDRQKLPK